MDETITEKLTLNAFEDLIEVMDKITMENDNIAPGNIDTDFKYIIPKEIPWDSTIKIIKTDRHEQ